ncbi:MAG: thiol reductant ABC exporter subunit CydC [Rhodoluna sp.]
MFSRQKDLVKIGLPRDGFFKLGILVSILQGLSAVALLASSAWLISRAAEVNSIVYLGVAIVGVRGFAVGRATFRYVERLLMHESAFRMLAEKRPQIFKALTPFIPAGMVERNRGETLSTVVSDVDELQNLPLRVIAPLAQAIVVSIASVVFTWSLLPAAGVALALSLAGGFLVALSLSARLSSRADLVISPLKARIAEQSIDLLENQEVYLAYGWMSHQRADFSATDIDLRKAQSRIAVASGLGLSLFSIFGNFAMLSGAWFGANAVQEGAVPGAFLAVFMLLPMAVFEVVQAAQPVVSAWRRYRVSAARVGELLNREVPLALDIESGEIALDSFESLKIRTGSVRYPDSHRQAFSGLELELHRGEVVLLAGESGAGKSSVAMVLARLLNLEAGAFAINGLEVSKYSMESVRSKIVYLEQVPTVFLGDVRANLALAKPGAMDGELIAALEAVGLWGMFSQREGLSTFLGDRGVAISGGEAQRLALARAILASFEVLILDEPTANLDRVTADSLIHDFVEIARVSGRTILLISHEERYRSLVDREIRL